MLMKTINLSDSTLEDAQEELWNAKEIDVWQFQFFNLFSLQYRLLPVRL